MSAYIAIDRRLQVEAVLPDQAVDCQRNDVHKAPENVEEGGCVASSPMPRRWEQEEED